MTELLLVHAVGPTHSAAKEAMNAQATIMSAGSDLLADGVTIARYRPGQGIQLFAPKGTKCLKAIIEGANQDQCNERFQILNELLQAGSTELPEWVVDLSWNHGGGGGP